MKKLIFMISDKKISKKLVAVIIVLSVISIMPTAFAGDAGTLNQSDYGEADLTASDVGDTLNLKSDTVYVDSSYEGDSGTGSIDNPVKSISEGLNLVNDGGSIYLRGKFSGDGNSNITLDGSADGITFIGMDAVVDGESSTSFLIINKGTYTFNNITFANNFKNGSDEEAGGAISNLNGDLTIINCLFENNTVYAVNRTNGGAIDNSGKLTVINSTFTNNVANNSNSSGFRKNAADGGAISNLGNLYIYNTLFLENKALRNGGAIRTQDGAKTYIENCEFNGNTAAYHESGGSYGGAVYSWDCNLDIYNSTFKNNKVIDISGYGAQGGAISYDRSSEVMNIISCQFINNTAEGVGLVSGQSIYMGGSAKINYCSIDTSLYSPSQNVDLNYNLWAVNDTSIRQLIEMLPASVKINSFAQVVLSTDDSELKEGETIPVHVKLCWNGTDNQNNIDLIPEQSVSLKSNCGVLSKSEGKLINGIFESTLKLNDTQNPEITVTINDVNAVFNLLNTDDNTVRISASCDDITEGETAVITVTSNRNITGLCLIEIGDGKYYAELVSGKAFADIVNLKAGKYIALIRLYGAEAQTTVPITVNADAAKNVKNTTIEIRPDFSLTACDISTGERGQSISFTLKDIDKNILADKTVQIALNGKIYDAVSDENGICQLEIRLNKADTYTCAVSFTGDENYNAAPLAISKLAVNKKKTSLSASSKTFKLKAKKQISVTLKTSKSPADGKTYLYKGKKVTLTVKGKTYSAKTNAKGVAKFNVKLTKKGKYSAKIKFSEDATYKASNKTIKITVK